VNSPDRSDSGLLNLSRDVPTTRADVEMMRQLRRESPSWLSLTPAELHALLPEDALERRAAMRADARPFELP